MSLTPAWLALGVAVVAVGLVALWTRSSTPAVSTAPALPGKRSEFRAQIQHALSLQGIQVTFDGNEAVFPGGRRLPTHGWKRWRDAVSLEMRAEAVRRAVDDLLLQAGGPVLPEAYKKEVLQALANAGIDAEPVEGELAITHGAGRLALVNLYSEIAGQPRSALAEHLANVVTAVREIEDLPDSWDEVEGEVRFDAITDAYLDNGWMQELRDGVEPCQYGPDASLILGAGGGVFLRFATFSEYQTRDLTHSLARWGIGLEQALDAAGRNLMGSALQTGELHGCHVVGMQRWDLAALLVTDGGYFRMLGIERRVVIVPVLKDLVYVIDADDHAALEALFTRLLDEPVPPRSFRYYPLTRAVLPADEPDPGPLDAWDYLRPEQVPPVLHEPLARLRSLDAAMCYPSAQRLLQEHLESQGVVVCGVDLDEDGKSFAVWPPGPCLLPFVERVIVLDAHSQAYRADFRALMELMGRTDADLEPGLALPYHRLGAFPDDRLDALRSIAEPLGTLVPPQVH